MRLDLLCCYCSSAAGLGCGIVHRIDGQRIPCDLCLKIGCQTLQTTVQPAGCCKLLLLLQAAAAAASCCCCCCCCCCKLLLLYHYLWAVLVCFEAGWEHGCLQGLSELLYQGHSPSPGMAQLVYHWNQSDTEPLRLHHQ